VLQGSKGLTKESQSRYNGVIRVLQGFYEGFYKGVTRVTRVLQE
jgi:hypothetical protein